MMERSLVEAAIDKGVSEHICHLVSVALMDWSDSSLERFKRGLLRALKAHDALLHTLDDSEPVA